jgi:peptidoglycan-associated lipoprotein
MQTKLLTLTLALALSLAGCSDYCEKSTVDKKHLKVSEAEISSLDDSVKSKAQKKFEEQVGNDRILFRFDSNELDKESRDYCQKVATYLIENPDSKLEIQGNCDKRGSPSYNEGLGDRRANSVVLIIKDLTQNSNFNPENIKGVSFGSRILVEGDTQEAYSQNRVAIFQIK